MTATQHGLTNCHVSCLSEFVSHFSLRNIMVRTPPSLFWMALLFASILLHDSAQAQSVDQRNLIQNPNGFGNLVCLHIVARHSDLSKLYKANF